MSRKNKKRKIKLGIILGIIVAVLLVGIIIVLIYGGTHGWFKFIIPSPQQNIITNLTQTPSTNVETYSTCTQLCSANNFVKGYQSSTCKGGETKIDYGYPQEIPLLKCCCYNPQSEITPPTPAYTCTDSDGKDNFAVSGNCQDSFHQLGFTDNCEGNNVIDYYCDSENICQKSTKQCIGDNFNANYCDNGKCFPTPSEDYENSPNSLCYNGCKNTGYGTGKWTYDWTLAGVCTQEKTQEICSYVGGVNKFETKTISGATCCCWCCHNNVQCTF